MRTMMLLTLGLVMSVPVSAFAGFGSHGGDPIAADFAKYAERIATAFSGRTVISGPLKSLEYRILLAYESTQIQATDNVLMEGTEQVCALNFPDLKEPKIQINRTCWRNLAGDQDRLQLVAHEYIGILKLLQLEKGYSLSHQAAKYTLKVEAMYKLPDYVQGGVFNTRSRGSCGWQINIDRDLWYHDEEWAHPATFTAIDNRLTGVTCADAGKVFSGYCASQRNSDLEVTRAVCKIDPSSRVSHQILWNQDGGFVQARLDGRVMYNFERMAW